MLNINNTNWVLIGIYFLVSAYTLLTIGSSSQDAAGKGMAGGFAIVIMVFSIVMAGLNLINTAWLKKVLLVILLLPLLSYLKSILRL